MPINRQVCGARHGGLRIQWITTNANLCVERTLIYQSLIVKSYKNIIALVTRPDIMRLIKLLKVRKWYTDDFTWPILVSFRWVTCGCEVWRLHRQWLPWSKCPTLRHLEWPTGDAWVGQGTYGGHWSLKTIYTTQVKIKSHNFGRCTYVRMCTWINRKG